MGLYIDGIFMDIRGYDGEWICVVEILTSLGLTFV